MPITAAGKDWIAKELGIGDCFVKPGFTWTAEAWDGATADESGGTAEIVGRLVTTAVYKEIRVKTPIVKTFTYAMIKAANGGVDITLPEVKAVIGDHDGYPAGQDQWCFVPGAPPSGEAVFYFCSLPGGATITVDGATVPWTAPLCPNYKAYNVTAATHTIRYSLAGYKDKELSVGTLAGGVLQVPGILEAVAGVNNGTLRLTAHDDKTGQVLHARPSISGTTEESKYLTPYTITLSIAAGQTSKEVDVGAIHPGYEKAERTVILKNTHTVANPLVVDLLLKEVRLWREVRIVKEMPTIAWVTGLSIPSVMAWGVNYTGWIKFVFTLAASYQAFLDLHPLPTGWDGKIGSLPASIERISTEIGTDLKPFPKNEVSLDWSWGPTSAIPEGNYVVVCELKYEV